VVQIDDVTLEKELLEFARFQVKIPVASTVRMERDICINGFSFKVLLEEEERVQDLEFNRFYAKWNGGFSEVDTEARSEEGELGGSFCDSVASDFGEGFGTGTGEDEAVQGKACTTVQLQEVTDFQESLRGAVNVVGPLENIPCRIEGLVEDGAEFIEGVAHSLEAWPAAKCDFKDVVKDALVLNKERELVEQVVGENNSLMSVGVGIKLVGNKERELVEQVVGEINSLMGAGVGNGLVGLNEERELVEKVVGENNSLMSGEVGNRLEGRAEVECDFIPCNIETTSHLPNIKEVHAKSYLAFNAGSSVSRVKES